MAYTGYSPPTFASHEGSAYVSPDPGAKHYSSPVHYPAPHEFGLSLSPSYASTASIGLSPPHTFDRRPTMPPPPLVHPNASTSSFEALPTPEFSVLDDAISLQQAQYLPPPPESGEKPLAWLAMPNTPKPVGAHCALASATNGGIVAPAGSPQMPSQASHAFHNPQLGAVPQHCDVVLSVKAIDALNNGKLLTASFVIRRAQGIAIAEEQYLESITIHRGGQLHLNRPLPQAGTDPDGRLFVVCLSLTQGVCELYAVPRIGGGSHSPSPGGSPISSAGPAGSQFPTAPSLLPGSYSSGQLVKQWSVPLPKRLKFQSKGPKTRIGIMLQNWGSSLELSGAKIWDIPAPVSASVTSEKTSPSSVAGSEKDDEEFRHDHHPMMRPRTPSTVCNDDHKSLTSGNPRSTSVSFLGEENTTEPTC